tara:strand:- start:248 stop:1033 length:786 start_codon:yes stop_codon:yes gene_type:complete
MTPYQFKLDIFEGPLDLLLFLIKEQKMDIYDIPIADVTKQYMDYLELIQELNLDVAGEYLIMAAELARVKSKTLLPHDPEATEEMDDEGIDPRDELTRRLLEYQRYKEAAFDLRHKEYERQQVFTRQSPMLPQVDHELPPGNANVFDLLVAFQKFIKGRDFKEEYEVKITTLSVSDRLESILEILNASKTVTFDSMFTVLNVKRELIVTFLALLELIRLRLVQVEQAGQFETIRLYLSSSKEEQGLAIRVYREAEETPPPL